MLSSQVQPIFEARYEHVQRSTDNFDGRPLSEGGKRLGSGSFGTVYHGVLHSETSVKFEVAIKRLKKVRLSCSVCQSNLSLHQSSFYLFVISMLRVLSFPVSFSPRRLPNPLFYQSALACTCLSEPAVFLSQASSLNPAQIEMSRKQFGTEMNIMTR